MANEFDEWAGCRLETNNSLSDEEWQEYQQLCEDWSDSLDDMDNMEWEQAMSKPDDYGYEDEVEISSDAYEQEDEEYMEYMSSEMSGMTEDLSTEKDFSRQIKIARWLERSSISMKHPIRKGFYVERGFIVRLLDKSSMDLIDWLANEGIRDGADLVAYLVKQEGDKEDGRLCFYTVINAPFYPSLPSTTCACDGDSEDDIPF